MHQGAYFQLQSYAQSLPLLDRKQQNNVQTKDVIGEHKNPKYSIVRECKCNFCGFCLRNHLKRHAKREIILFFLRVTPFAGTCIQQLHILSLCIATSKIIRYSTI